MQHLLLTPVASLAQESNMDETPFSVFILVFLVGMFLGGMFVALASDDYASRAMQCVVYQTQASSTDPIATCSKILNVQPSNHHD